MRVADGPPKKGGGQIQKSWWKARVASDDKAAPFGDVAASNARQAAIVFARDSRRMNQLGLTIEVITHEGIERFEVVPRVAFIATSVGVQVLPAVNSAGR